jgi:Glucodextranase, domain B
MRPTGRFALAALVALLALVPLSAQAGRRPPKLTVTAPVHGVFSTAANVTVTGLVENVVSTDAVVTVNGATVPVNPDGSFSAVVALNPSIVFNPIETRLVAPRFLVDRRVVVAGASVADGAFSNQAIGLRLNDSGLDQLEPVVTSLVDLDLATLLPPGTLVIDNYCYASIFGACIGRVDAVIDGAPPPSIGSFGIDIDSQPGMAFGDINLQNLFVRARVFAVSGIGFTCHLNVTAATTQIQGDYALSPMASNPENVDVQQLGGANVIFHEFSDTNNCDGFLGGVVEFFIDLFVGDIQDLMEPAFENFLNTQDGAGNTPVAGAIESALADIEIAGPIGESLGVVLDAPLFAVNEDAAGITLGSNARILSTLGQPGCTPPPGTPNLAASLHVPEPFPSFGANTPGGVPYDLGIAISSAAFNQLLKAQIECGLLQTDLDEIEIFGTTVPLTAGLASLLIPQFGQLLPSTPLIARIQPSLAPAITGNAGPAGELVEMRMGQLVVDLRDDPLGGSGHDLSYVKIAIDLRAGVDFAFAGGELVPTISTIDPANVTVGVASSQFLTVSPEDLQDAVPILLQGALPVLSGALGAFPIPSFFGFQLDPVSTGMNGEFLAIFANLEPGP